MFNNTFNGLSAEEYSDILAMCVNWYKFETTLFSGADKEDRVKSAYYNIVSLDPYDIDKMYSVLRTTTESRTLSRLRSIFFAVRIRLGDKTTTGMIKSHANEIIKHPEYNYSKVHTDALFTRHPYVVLIPLLTFIFMKDQTLS